MKKKGSKTMRKVEKVKKRNLYLTPIQTKRFSTTRAQERASCDHEKWTQYFSSPTFFFSAQNSTTNKERKLAFCKYNFFLFSLTK
jgi:hypothetical protein